MRPIYAHRCGYNRVRENKDGTYRFWGWQDCAFVPSKKDAWRFAAHMTDNLTQDGFTIRSWGSGVREDLRNPGWGFETFWALATFGGRRHSKCGQPLVRSGIDGRPFCLECSDQKRSR